MNYRMTARLDRPRQQAFAYSMHALIFIALAFFSQEPWITLLCALLSCIAGVKSIALLSNAIHYGDVMMPKGFTGFPQHMNRRRN
jgi:hypothetical protein